MKLSQMLVGSIVVIAITTISGTNGIPKPQGFIEVDGFAFKGQIDRSGASQSPDVPPLIEPESTTEFNNPETQTPSPTTLIFVPESTPTINTPAVELSSTQPVSQRPDLVQCTQNCQFRVTAEYNPVCGSDRSVYKNPGMLTCVKGCGHDVNHAYFGPCISQIRG